MKISIPFYDNEKLAFHLFYIAKVEDGKHCYYIQSTLPREALVDADPTIHLKEDSNYSPSLLEAKQELITLGNKVIAKKRAKNFYYADYLLIENELHNYVRKDIIKLQEYFEPAPGFYTSTTNSMMFYALSFNYWRFFQYKRRVFNKEVLPTDRTSLEEVLTDMRSRMEYVERYESTNKFFTTSENGLETVIMTDGKLSPLMIIISQKK